MRFMPALVLFPTFVERIRDLIAQCNLENIIDLNRDERESKSTLVSLILIYPVVSSTMSNFDPVNYNLA